MTKETKPNKYRLQLFPRMAIKKLATFGQSDTMKRHTILKGPPEDSINVYAKLYRTVNASR